MYTKLRHAHDLHNPSIKTNGLLRLWDSLCLSFYCDKREFVKLFRSVGQSPSEATLKEIIDKYDPEKTGKIGFHTFLQICDSPFFADPVREERLLECFRVFDDDALGKMGVAELRFVLQQIGEPLADDEADKFIEWAMKVGRVRSCSPARLLLSLKNPFICEVMKQSNALFLKCSASGCLMTDWSQP